MNFRSMGVRFRIAENSRPLLSVRPKSILNLTLLILFLSNPSIGAVLDENTHNSDLGVDSTRISWLPGEKYDPFSGQMNHEMIDMEVTGNGLPITVSRHYQQGGSGGEFGYMTMNLPTISFKMVARDGYTGLCNDLHLVDHSQAGDAHKMLLSPIQFKDGSQKRFFFSTAESDKPNYISQFPPNAEYVSLSNWFIRCSWDNDARVQRFKVYSPDGMEYELGKFSGMYHYVTARVTKIVDPYGNWLVYHYEGGRRSQIGLKSQQAVDKLLRIEASDGRNVHFSHDALRRITEIKSNGWPNPKIVKYTYNDNEKSLSVYHNDYDGPRYYYRFNREKGALQSVTYPTGGGIGYQYSNSLSSTTSYNLHDLGKYFPLVKRIQSEDGVGDSDSGIYSFSYQNRDNNQFSRIVSTPHAHIDYKYQKSSRHANIRDVATSAVGTSDGRLLQIATFNKSAAYDSARSPSHWDLGTRGLEAITRFYYKKLYRLSSLNAQETNKVVIHQKIQQVKNGKSIFRTNYTNHNSYGLPGLITESGPDGKVRSTTIYYRHRYGFRGWIAGKVSRKQVSDGSYQAYSYNRYGDVTNKNINGISTAFEYYEYGYHAGQIQKVSNNEGHVYHYYDYYRGIPRKEIDQLGIVKTRAVNGDGTIDWESRLGDEGAKWIYNYDKLQRLVNIKSPRYETQDIRINWVTNNKIEVTPSDNSYKVHTIFDGFGREIFNGTNIPTAPNRNWRSREYRYDHAGRKTFESYPTNAGSWIIGSVITRGTKYEYDSLNRYTAHSAGYGGPTSTPWTRTTFEYGNDDQGNLQIIRRDSRQKKTTTTFESYGSPRYDFHIRHTDANNVTTFFDRDAMGRVKSIDRSGVQRTYEYNGNKLLQSATQPENGYTSYQYYSDGMLLSSTNNGRKIDYEYRKDNSLDLVAFRDPSGHSVIRDYGYDWHGNLQFIKNDSDDGTQRNEIWYKYNREDSLTSERFIVDGNAFQLTYEYDGHSNLKATTYPNGRKYHYHPNAYGEPAQIVGSDGKVIYEEVNYHPNGKFDHLKRGSHEFLTYLDPQLRPVRRRLSTRWTNDAQGEYKYQYDTESNVTRIDIGARQPDSSYQQTNLVMDYDNKNRLNAVHFSNADNWRFQYDAHDDIDWIQHGNNFINYSYSWDRRLQSVTSSNPTRRFTYDARGNTTSIDMNSRDSAGGPVVNRRLSVNPADQMTRVSDGSTYAYDGWGLRIKQQKNGSGTVYTFYDADGKLRYRQDYGTAVSSEYFYVSDHLIARRDTDISEGWQQ